MQLYINLIKACWEGKAMGVTFIFCYDYGYKPSVDPEKVVIIQYQNYMSIY